MKQYPEKGFTHAGKFHADDVFSTALLLYLNPEFHYTRGFEIPQDFDGIVYDIGWGEFDHHQADARIRENGTPYAAFGLLWEKYGADILGEQEAKRMDALFVQPLDLSDNNGTANMICEIIESFNPVWDSTESEDEAFAQALFVAGIILKKKFDSVLSVKRGETFVKAAIEKAQDHIMILEKTVPWKQLVPATDIEYVVYPSKRGGYAAQAVPMHPDQLELKRPFPEEWRGADAEELAAMSGVSGFRFCHKSGFLLTADTLEEALQCCKISQRKHN